MAIEEIVNDTTDPSAIMKRMYTWAKNSAARP